MGSFSTEEERVYGNYRLVKYIQDFYLKSIVREEIQKAIKIGMNSPDPKAKAIWDSVPKKGDKPTSEETAVYLTKITKKKY